MRRPDVILAVNCVCWWKYISICGLSSLSRFLQKSRTKSRQQMRNITQSDTESKEALIIKCEFLSILLWVYRSTSGSIIYSTMAALLTVLPGNQMSNSTPKDAFLPVSICRIKEMQLRNKSWGRKHTKLHFAFNNNKDIIKDNNPDAQWPGIFY